MLRKVDENEAEIWFPTCLNQLNLNFMAQKIANTELLLIHMCIVSRKAQRKDV